MVKVVTKPFTYCHMHICRGTVHQLSVDQAQELVRHPDVEFLEQVPEHGDAMVTLSFLGPDQLRIIEPGRDVGTTTSGPIDDHGDPLERVNIQWFDHRQPFEADLSSRSQRSR